MELTKEYFDQHMVSINRKFDIILSTMALHTDLVELKASLPKQKTIHDLYSVVDSFMKQVQNYEEQSLVLAHKVERIEEWIVDAAPEVGITFNL